MVIPVWTAGTAHGIRTTFSRPHCWTAPELAEAFAKYDIFAPSFALSCLNRLQLKNNQQMVDLTDFAGSLQFVGTVGEPTGCG